MNSFSYQKYPRDPFIKFNIANSWISLERADEALNCFNEIEKIIPDNFDIKYC